MDRYDFETVIDRRTSGSLKWDKYAGRDILPMWVADMDFAAPPEVVEAIRQRSAHPVFGYTRPTPAVVESVLHYLETVHRWKVQPEWLVWLPGLVPALAVGARAIGEPGDGVLTHTPIYPPFLTVPPQAGRRLQAVPLRQVGGQWRFDWQEMERAIDHRTRLFFFCNPHNPTGRVFNRRELEELAEFAVRHDLVICADEVHCDLILDPVRHIPLATIDAEMANRTVTLLAPSKTFNVPGLACAYAVIPETGLRKRFLRAADGLLPEINPFGFTACQAAYNHGWPWHQALLEVLRGNRDRLYESLGQQCPEIPLLPMEATYLAWLDVRAYRWTDPVAHLEKHGLGLSDGRYFGAPGWLRLNFGCPRAILEEGLRRLIAACHAAERI